MATSARRNARNRRNGVAAPNASPSFRAGDHAPANPYGDLPGGGITLPPYYRPTGTLKNNNNYFPGSETLASNEMRISFLGSTPFPPTKTQAGTCIMVELGNGRRFFFDFGSGCVRNVIAMQVPLQMVNDIFITHLHVDHYADLPYLYCFAPGGVGGAIGSSGIGGAMAGSSGSAGTVQMGGTNMVTTGECADLPAAGT